MSIARQFYLLVCAPPLLAVAFGIAFSHQLTRQTAEGARLLSSAARIERISQRLTRGNAEQIALLNQQLENLDPSFPERLRWIGYEMGEACTDYQRLDIGTDERLTVDRIKSLQSEIGLRAVRIYRELAGAATPATLGESSDRRALTGLRDVHVLETDLREEFEKLDGAQLARLNALLAQIDRLARQGDLASGALLLSLLFAAAATAFTLRRRVLQPVAAILDASDRIRVGDLSARVPGEPPNEIGRLICGFNFMAESLADNYGSLERKVEERTAELEKVQEQLLQSEKLSAMGLLVGGVAHELNNPLAAVVGFTELARMRLAGNADRADVETLLVQVDTQTERCRRIVDNLLQFARKREPRLEAFDLNAAVDQTLALRAYELDTGGVRLDRRFDLSAPVAMADRDKVQQVVLNLLNNAADAIAETGRPGTITVRTKAHDGRVSLEFLDDGAGFRDPARAFDPFYTTKAVGKGTGLGLSVCYGIVREHGGQITAENTGRGARVAVTLPAGRREHISAAAEWARAAGPSASHANAAQVPPAAVGAPTARSAARVLVVDDEKPLVRLQAAFLKKMGHDVVQATTAQEAIACLGECAVDLIVSDVRMPGMDGIALYDWVREHRPTLLSRFLFTSGDMVSVGSQTFFARTGAPYISKPFRYDEYETAVRETLKNVRVHE